MKRHVIAWLTLTLHFRNILKTTGEYVIISFEKTSPGAAARGIRPEREIVYVSDMGRRLTGGRRTVSGYSRRFAAALYCLRN